MIVEETLTKLRAMKFYGMADAFEQQLAQPETASLAFEDRFGLLVDQEWIYRENRKLSYRLGRAKLQDPGGLCGEDRLPGAPEAEQIPPAAVNEHGLGGKTSECDHHRPHRQRKKLPGLRPGTEGLPGRPLCPVLSTATASAGDGAWPGRTAPTENGYSKLPAFNVLILDDWGLTALQDMERRDLLEILEDRHNVSSTIVTSQLPISKWHDVIGDPTIADAILDRVVHNAHKIELKGESVRKTKAKLD